MKIATAVNASKFATEIDLAGFKSDTNDLDIEKFKTVPADAVKNDIVIIKIDKIEK